MKKLTLLLTSFLLASGASAAMLDFEGVEPQVTESQDFQVAHPCNIGLIHTPPPHNSHVNFGEIGARGEDGRGHVRGPVGGAKCEHDWKIKKCKWVNRVINLWADSNDSNKWAHPDEVCGHTCPQGTRTGDGGYAFKCVPLTADECHRNGHAIQNGVCKPCPANHSYQSAHRKCVSFADLAKYCNSRKEIYNSASDKCERCPADRPKIENNECMATTCPANHYWQEVHKRCVPFDVLDTYCANAHSKVYDPQTSTCICPNRKPFENRNGTCKNYCRNFGSNFVYHPQSDSCRNYCPPPQTPDIHGVCR